MENLPQIDIKSLLGLYKHLIQTDWDGLVPNIYWLTCEERGELSCYKKYPRIDSGLRLEYGKIEAIPRFVFGYVRI